MANISAIRKQPAHTTYQLSSPNCSTKAIQKVYLLRKNTGKKLWRKRKRKATKMDHQQKDDKTERATRLGRKTREKIGKGMTSLRFRQKVDTRPPGLLSGDTKEKLKQTDQLTVQCFHVNHQRFPAEHQLQQSIFLWIHLIPLCSEQTGQLLSKKGYFNINCKEPAVCL